MKNQLIKLSRWIFPLIILLLFSLNVFCRETNDKASKKDSIAYYDFWQKADLYILEKIGSKFKDSLSGKLKDSLEKKITTLEKVDSLYYNYSKNKDTLYIFDESLDYLYEFNVLLKSKISLYKFVNDSLLLIKLESRGDAVTSGSDSLNKEFNKFKKRINDEIEAYIEIATRKRTPPSTIADYKNLINNSDNASKSSLYFNILLLILFISVGGIFFLFFVFRRNINNRFDQLNGELLTLKSSFTRQFDAKDEEWRKRNSDLQNSFSNRLSDTKKDLDDLYQHVQQYQVQNQGNRTFESFQTEKPLAPPPPPVKKYKIYYLQSPDPQGFFWDDKKSLIADGGTFYELTVEDESPSTGKLVFYTKNEKNVRNALNNPNLYLKPVCQSVDGIYSGNTIIVKSPGKLQLSGDKWQLANGEKVKIAIV